MSDEPPKKASITQPKKGDRDIRYYCPYCKEILTADLKDVGQTRECGACDNHSIIPKRKLSIKGDLPTGGGIEPLESEDKESESLSLSSNPDGVKPVAIGGPGPEIVPTQVTVKRDSQIAKWIKVAAAAGVALALVMVLVMRSGVLEPSPISAEDAKPSEEVVFSMIDIAIQRLQKAETSNEIRNSDMLTLNLLVDSGGKGRDVELLQEAIDKREASIQQDLAQATETLVELTIAHDKWAGYIEQMLEQKLTQARNERKLTKAQWIEALSRTVQEAPDNELAARDYIRGKIAL